jgi:hypothetical protein
MRYSIDLEKSAWGSIRCHECGITYSEEALLQELLIGWADPNYPYLRLLNRNQLIGFNCYNIGSKKSTIWDLCREFNCPNEEKCDYYCPAFLSILGLIDRGKVSIGLPWGDYHGGDLHGYKIRWKRTKDDGE